jgi:hypothetical protein
VVPPNGVWQRRWTCGDCGANEGVTARYQPLGPMPAGDYVVADIYSCGEPRFVGMQVLDALGQSCTVFSTACHEGVSPRNEWERIYVDLTACPGLGDVVAVEFITQDLEWDKAIYLSDVRVEGSEPSCGNTDCGGVACTPTATGTPTETSTPCLAMNGDTCTFTETPTYYETYTPTHSPTWTPTPTPTAWPIMVFPNPADFQSNDPHDHYCPPGMREHGCVKFIGLPKGSSLTIYTLSLMKVRTYTAADVAGFGTPPAIGGTAMGGDLAWVAWEGDNDDRNPVSAGIYFYVVESPGGGKFVGRLAVARSGK